MKEANNPIFWLGLGYSKKKKGFNVYFAFQAILSILFFHEKCHFFGWDNKLGLQDPHELIRYWSPIYVLCVSSHFWPFTKANLVLENFNKNLGFGQTPPPLVGPNAQLFPKMHFEGPPYKQSVVRGWVTEDLREVKTGFGLSCIVLDLDVHLMSLTLTRFGFSW